MTEERAQKRSKTAHYDTTRFIENPYFGREAQAVKEIKTNWFDAAQDLASYLLKHFPPVKNAGRDYELYTGYGGLAYTCLHCYLQLEKLPNANDAHVERLRALLLEKGNAYLAGALTGAAKDRDPSPTFITGTPGIDALDAVYAQLAANATTDQAAKEKLIERRDQAIARILAAYPDDEDEEVPDELLYGRAGYLYALLWLANMLGVRHEFALPSAAPAAKSSGQERKAEAAASTVDQPGPVPASPPLTAGQIGGINRSIQSAFDAIVENGLAYVREHYKSVGASRRPPLMWQWHRKRYLGGAHGVAGILYMLLAVREKWDASSEVRNLVFGTVDYLLTKRFPSGNYASNDKSPETDDRLVHWCHGAPGIAMLLARAAAAAARCSDARVKAKAEGYMKAAEEAGLVVWERGLLWKGMGACHGISGNALVFLNLYKATKSPIWLERACLFGEFSQVTEHKPRLWAQPDNPYSLYEGLAANLWLLVDLLVPDAPLTGFPGYDFA